MPRPAAAAIAWAGAAGLDVIWVLTRGSLELNGGSAGAGIPLALRFDAVAFACSVTIVGGGAALLTVRPNERWTLLLALAAAVASVSASDLLLTAAAAGVALLFALDAAAEEPGAEWAVWGAILLTAWAAVSLQVVGGTSGYGAAPAGALNSGIAGLILLAAIAFVAGLPLGAPASASVRITFAPIGFCLLLRVYTIGVGRLPHPALNLGLALAGVLVLGISGWRAAGAAGWRELLAEAVPGVTGAGLLAAAAGDQLGAVAVTFALFATAVTAVVAEVGPGRRRLNAWLIAAVIAGVPPMLVFSTRLLAIQAALESDALAAWIALPAMLGVVLWLFAAARAAALPATGGRSSRWQVPFLAAGSLLGGIAAGPIAFAVAQPVAAAAGLGRAGPRVTSSVLGLEPASAGWPALVLGALLVAGLAAAVFGLRARIAGAAAAEPLVPGVPLPAVTMGRPAIRGLAAVEAALAGRRPLLWAALIVALALVVTRAPL